MATTTKDKKQITVILDTEDVDTFMILKERLEVKTGIKSLSDAEVMRQALRYTARQVVK